MKTLTDTAPIPSTSAWHAIGVRVLCGLVLMASAGTLLARGYLKPTGRLYDFAIIYSSSVAWLEKANPYDHAAINQWWKRSGGAPTIPDDLSWLPPVVPPTTLVAFVPFAGFDPPVARWGWLGVTIVSVGALLIACCRISGLSPSHPWALLAMAWLLASGPLHTAVLVGQPALPASACIVLGAWAALKRRDFTAGVLFAMGAAFKFQLSVPFLLLYAYLGRRRVWLAGGITLMSIVAIGFAWMATGTGGWLTAWRDNLHVAHGPGGVNDYGLANTTRYHLLNLHLLISVAGFSRITNDLIVAALTISVASLFVYFTWQRRQHLDERLALAFSAVALLLPVYHRYYDSLLLVLVMAWALSALSGEYRRRAIAMIVLLLGFLAPLAFAFNLITYRILPTSVESNLLWQLFVVPHHIYALLGILILLMTVLVSKAKMGSATTTAARLTTVGKA